MSKIRQYGDALERTLWTAAEGAGAVGLVAGYQALPLADIPAGYVVVTTVLVGALLAAGKGIIATNVGNGTASLGLPLDLEPIPAEATQGDMPNGVGMPLAEPADPLYVSGRDQLPSQHPDRDDPELDDELITANDEKPRHARDDDGDGVPDVAR